MKFRFLLYIIPLLLFYSIHSKSSFAQQDTSRDKSRIALSHFIEGKTLELKNNFIGAIEKYRTALKYDESAGIYFTLASVYYKVSKFKEALTEINKALRLDPNNISYLEKLADIHLGTRDFQKAANTYEKILILDKDYTVGLYTLARLYQELNMPAKAIIVYEKITEKIGYDFDVLNKMYEIYINYKDYQKAADVLEGITKIDPYNVEVRKILASMYIRSEQIDEAQKIYEQLFMLNPDDKAVQTELVRIYFKKDESDKAFERFAKMTGKDSLGFWEKLQVGELYYNMIAQDQAAANIARNIFYNLSGNYPDQWIPYYYIGAIDILEKKDGYSASFDKALQRADTARDAYFNIGFTYFQRGENEKADDIFSIGLNKFPSDYRFNYFKGLLLQRMNNEREAVVYFERALEFVPEDIIILSALALAYNNLGMFDKSVATYEKALLIEPRNPIILNNYAYNLSERDEQLDRALVMAKIAIEIEPENASFLDTIGWVYFKLGKYKDAEKFIKKSLAVNKESAVVLEHLGDIYKAMKEDKNALIYWKLALEKNPANNSLKQKIERMN
jgi:tetratricopeptide (TPR) repeat protein